MEIRNGLETGVRQKTEEIQKEKTGRNSVGWVTTW
jgi:hypothetical protein